MDIRRTALIFGGTVLIVILAVYAGNYFFGPGPGSQIDSRIQVNQTGPAAPREPEVHFYAKDKHTVVVAWKNLPNGTTELDILRSLKGKENFAKWKTIAISGNGSNGSIELTLSGREDANQYVFQAQAVGNNAGSSGAGGSPGSQGNASGTGQGTPQVLWESETQAPAPLPPELGGPPAGGSPSAPSAASSSSETSTPTPTPTPVGAPAASSTTPSPVAAPPPPPPSFSSDNFVYYYTPQGTVSGTSTILKSDLFWAQYADKTIEIGWQNIPGAADKLVISRSLSASGPWITLLEQQDPPSAYTIRIVDRTLDETHPYYYKLEASAAGTMVATYGPSVLTPVQ